MSESLRESLNVSKRECFCWPKQGEIVCRSGFTNVNIVFLICLMFIFERPIQMTLFRIHLVSVIKCVTCQVRFWINYWRAWMDKHSLRYLILPSSISVAWNIAEVILIIYVKRMRGLILHHVYGLILSKQQCNSLLSSSPTQWVVLCENYIDWSILYSHVFEIFVSEK